MFRQILVPVDGSARAVEAVDVARHLAWRVGASVTLVRVRVKEPLADLPAVLATHQDLERLVLELRAQGIDARHFVEYGNVPEGIAATADYRHADLIIMAPHHRGRLETLQHRSVTARLFSHASAPLLVWPEQGPGAKYSSFLHLPGSCVIVPLDGSDLAEQAIPFALAFVKEFGRPLLLVQVVPRVVLGGSGPATTWRAADRREKQHHAAQSYLKAVRLRLMAPGAQPIYSTLLDGDPAQQLLRLASSHEGSLLIMSTHGRTGVHRLLMGSVAAQVMRESPLPLLIVPPQAAVPLELDVGAAAVVQAKEGDQAPAR
jgi:nucleotide-binding universal stress UspA family protein